MRGQIQKKGSLDPRRKGSYRDMTTGLGIGVARLNKRMNRHCLFHPHQGQIKEAWEVQREVKR